MFVSIVIATRNRSALVGRTLEALAAQHWPAERLEIIVADNGSTDGTGTVVERAGGRGQPLRYLFVAEPGKSHAVNAALEVARGDLIALTDDDVLPDSGWIAALVQAVTETDADFVAGRILPLWEVDPPSWISPPVYGVLAIPDNGPERQTISASSPSHIMPIGANMAVRRAVVARIGGLRADLGKYEGTLRTGEDHEFFLRMLGAGCAGVYEPSAIVHHFVPRGRLRRGYFRQWMHQNGRDVARLERVYTPEVARLLGVPRYLWREAAADALRAVRATLRGDGRERFASSLRLGWFAGYLRESWPGLSFSSPDAVHFAGGR